MITQEFQYQLAKRGKWICPECGRKTFVCYVDSNGNVLNEGVGKCDRADHCGYHKPPREYFEEQRRMGIDVTRHHPRPTYKQAPTQTPTYIDEETFKKSLKHYDCNHLITFLNKMFGSGAVDKMIAEYYIGTSQHWSGSTVFWQRDLFGRVHGGKIMQYNPDNGKRVKEPHNRITWVHTAFKIPKFNLRQCLFGEHLLAKHPDMFVGIVESEKTAIIASGVVTDCIFLACGGCQNLTIAMCEPLRGRNVVLFPDNGRYTCYQDKKGNWYDGWSEKGKQLRHLFKTLQIADIMERPDIIKQYDLKDGDDIGDLIIARNLDIKGLDFGFKEL